jgi:apolipoprotein N-acyltransferase
MMKKQSLTMTIIWLAIFGLLNLFSSGRWTMAVAAWVAPIFALRFLHTHKGRRTFRMFFLVNWVTLSIAWYGATPVWGAAHFIFMGVNALIGSLPFFFDHWLVSRIEGDGRSPFGVTLVYPLAATAVEYVAVAANPIGNFGAAGYGQYGVTPIMQLAAVTGMLGISLLVAWFASVVNWAWCQEFSWQRVKVGVMTYAALLLAVVGYGVVRMAAAPESTSTVEIASFTLVDINMQEMNGLLAGDREGFRSETQAIHARYLAETEKAAGEGASIVVWPEMAGLGLESDVAALVAAGRTLAQVEGIYLAMPTMTLYPDSERPAENVLKMAGPDGEIVLEHVKYGGNMIEGSLKGSGQLQVVETPFGKLSAVICWDTNYPAIIRQAGEQGVDILLSPSLEWSGIDPMHGEMSAFRAVENGMSVVRQADKGLSLVTGPYGRTLATAGAGDSHMRAAVPTSGVSTPYVQVGDAAGVAALVGTVIVLIWGVATGRRRVARIDEEAISTLS